MDNSFIEKQTKELVAHMNDYQKATQLKKRGEAAIFNKHKQADGQFGEGLKDDLTQYRKNFAQEWGINGWRNTQFVKQQAEAAQRPTDTQIDEMYQDQLAQEQETTAKREEFLKSIQNNQPKPQQGPKPR